MSISRGFLAPFSFVWNHSNLMAPARNIIHEGEHWTDYACAAAYVLFVFGALLLLAFHVTMDTILVIGGVAAAVVVLKYAWYYLFR